MGIAWDTGLELLQRALGEPQAGLQVLLRSLIGEGWTRGDLHAAVDELCGRPGTSEPVVDDLIELDTALTGWCAPSAIIRFPGDPDDERALVAHVRGGAWKPDHPVRDERDLQGGREAEVGE